MFDYKSIRFAKKRYAQKALDALNETIDSTGFVTVKDLKRCSMDRPEIYDYDSGLGWRDIDAADICQIANQWYIRLPSPEPVENLYRGV